MTLLGELVHEDREQRASVAWIERAEDRCSFVGRLFAEDAEGRWTG